MLWLIFTIILVVVGCIGLFLTMAGEDRTEKGWGWGLFLGSIAAWAVLSFFLSIHTVGQRQVGVVQSFSGTISGIKSPGIVFTAPWNHVKTEHVGVQKETFVFDSDNSAVSKDQQPITAQIVLNYQVSEKDVLTLWKTVGPSWRATLLDGRVPQDFKETTARMTSPEITLNRPLLRTNTLSRLRQELCPRSKEEPFCVNVVDLFVSNVGYSRSYTNAIEAKQVQVQQALQAEAKVAQAKAEAQQRVATANGEAQATVLKATADARALSLKGRALRNNPEILKLEAVDKLNPNAQVVICTGNTCPSILPTSTPLGGGR